MNANTQYENLVLESGGAKSVGYLGAFEVLEKKGILQNILRVSGASASAILALLVSLNYTTAEMTDVFWKELDFAKILDKPAVFPLNLLHFVKSYGWYKGAYIEEVLEKLVERKTGNKNITFQELHNLKDEQGFKDLYIPAMNCNTCFIPVFSHESSPGVPIIKAIKASLSTALAFPPVEINGDLFIDPVFTQKYPIEIFDQIKYRSNRQTVESFVKDGNEATLGLRLDTEEEIQIFKGQANPVSHKIGKNKNKSFKGYIKRLIKIILNYSEIKHFMNARTCKNRSIHINTLDASFLDFKMTFDMKMKLIKSGQKSTEEFFETLVETSQSPSSEGEPYYI